MAGTNIFAAGGRLGVGLLSNSDTTPIVPLGTVVSGYDENSSTNGEYMYVQFVAATTVGQICYIDLTSKATKASTTQANGGKAVGFAVAAANAIDEYGWLQIAGKAKAKAGTVAAGGKVMLTAVAGTIDDAAVAGSQILGAQFDTADGTPAAGFAYVACNRPSIQSQIT